MIDQANELLRAIVTTKADPETIVDRVEYRVLCLADLETYLLGAAQTCVFLNKKRAAKRITKAMESIKIKREH